MEWLAAGFVVLLVVGLLFGPADDGTMHPIWKVIIVACALYTAYTVVSGTAGVGGSHRECGSGPTRYPC